MALALLHPHPIPITIPIPIPSPSHPRYLRLRRLHFVLSLHQLLVDLLQPGCPDLCRRVDVRESRDPSGTLRQWGGTMQGCQWGGAAGWLQGHAGLGCKKLSAKRPVMGAWGRCKDASSWVQG